MFLRSIKIIFSVLIILSLMPYFILNGQDNTDINKYSIESYTKTKWGSDYTVDVRLRTIDVTVLDKDGKHVLGLKSEDFKIFEDGVEQKISSFDFVNHLKHFDKITSTNEKAADVKPVVEEKTVEPRYFALAVLDMTMYPKRNRQVIKAIEDFVITKISSEDYVALFQVSNSFVKCMMPFTKSHDLLLQKLSNEKEELIFTDKNLAMTNRLTDSMMKIINEYEELGIIRDDADATEYAQSLFDREKNHDFTMVMNNIRLLGNSVKDYIGKKNVVLFSTGLPYAIETSKVMKPRFSSEIRRAITDVSNDFNAFNISMFVMDLGKWEVQGSIENMQLDDRKDKMTKLSDNEASRVAGFRSVSGITGGEFYYHTLSSPEELQRSFDDVNYKTGIYYTIGYYAKNDPVPGKNVDIDVITDQENVDLTFRKKLYTPKKYNQLNTREKEQYFTNAVFSPGMYSQIFLTSDIHLFPTAGDKFIAQYIFQMDKKEIIHKFNDKPVSKLDLVLLVFTENREILKNSHKVLDIDFYDRYEKKNIEKVRFYDYTVLPQGKYIIRYFIRDQFTGNIASDELNITVPNREKEDFALSSLMVIGENRNLMVLSEHIPLPGREDIEVDPENPQYYNGDILSQTITEPIRTHEDCFLFFSMSPSTNDEILEKSFNFSITSKSNNYKTNIKPKLVSKVKHLDGTIGFLYKINNANLKQDDYIVTLLMTDSKGKRYESISIFKVL